MYGFTGKLNNGVGIYKFDFLSDLLINSQYLPYTEQANDKICSLVGHPNGWLFQYKSLVDIPAFKVEVKGIVNDNFIYRYYKEDGKRGTDIIIDKDGIYELPISYSVTNNAGVGIYCTNVCVDDVCFIQIPDYPNSLCYAGKQYCQAYNIPKFTDYTIITRRAILSLKGSFGLISKRISPKQLGAFILEKDNNIAGEEPNTLRAYTFMTSTAVNPKVNLWDEIDKEVCSLNNDQQSILAKDDVYNNVSAELQMLIQQELINSVRDKVANSPRGKELLEKQLNNIRAKKDSIIEEANKELELFKKFQIAAQANPKLTYVDFCNNIKNKEV